MCVCGGDTGWKQFSRKMRIKVQILHALLRKHAFDFSVSYPRRMAEKIMLIDHSIFETKQKNCAYKTVTYPILSDW